MEKSRNSSGNYGISRYDILTGIRNKLSEITGGEFDRPVFLKNVTVSDPECSWRKEKEYFSLNSLFYSNDKLCGDLMPLGGHCRGKSLVFGKVIEECSLEDLKHILGGLNRENWFVLDTGCRTPSHKPALSLRELFLNRFRRAFP